MDINKAEKIKIYKCKFFKTQNLRWIIKFKKLLNILKMGFLDSIFGTEEKKRCEPVRPQQVDIDEIIKGLEKTGVNVGGEVGKGHMVKSLPLTNEIDAEAGRTELMEGNIVVFRIDKEILYPLNKEYSLSILSRVKQIADALHGDVKQITEDKLLVVPAGIKIIKE